MSAFADRDLLLGMLAVQLSFISSDDLVVAAEAWRLNKSKPFGDLLRDEGYLSSEELQHLAALAELHSKRNDNSSQQSLAALRPGDVTLQQQLASVQDADINATLMQAGAGQSDTTPTEAGAAIAGPGSAIPAGRYRILKPHAKGGLGQVFVARDTELGRLVALKEIQPRHAHDPDCRGRFILEAEVTGGLEHPGIVPIYGLGHYADGRPYYAMRFIKGDDLRTALRRFHERSSSSPPFDSIAFRQLLGRFVDVCQAVAYAHSRGVLHRDLKPGNVMLGPYGETLVVDWGLAKVVGRPNDNSPPVDGEAALHVQSGGDSSTTEAGRALGTPAYMPPEQAAGEWDQLGPASDVYSLGATLYELLTGKPPFESGLFDVVMNNVREGLFPAPRRIAPAVPRALEAVCLKAMARKPSDRYAAALDLAKEVECWLADEPVNAWREPAFVRTRRWMRRHRTAMAAAAVLLATSAVSLGFLYAHSEHARAQIVEEQKKTAAALQQAEMNESTANAERRRAEEEGRIAQAVRDFLQNKLLGQTDTLTQANALLQAGRSSQEAELDPRISTLLDRAAAELTPEKIESHFPKQPLVQAEILDTIGETYRGIGNYAAAIEHLERARDLHLTNRGPNHADTLMTLSKLGAAYFATGRLADAIRIFETTRDGMMTTLGADHQDTLATLNSLARAYQKSRRLPEAIKLYERVRDAQLARLGADHSDTLATLNNLATAFHDSGKLPEAIRLFEQVRDVKIAKLGPGHPATLVTLSNLASAHRDSGELSVAIGLLEQVCAARVAKLGADHPGTLVTRAHLGKAYQAANNLPDAVRHFEEAVAGLERRSFQHDYAGPILSDAVRCFEQSKDFEKALLWRQKWLAILKKESGAKSMAYATELTGLGGNLIQQKKYAEAEAALRESLAIREPKEPEDWRTFNTKSMLGEALAGQKRYADAEPFAINGYEGLKKHFIEQAPTANERTPKSPTPAPSVPIGRLIEAIDRLIRLYDESGNHVEAAKWKAELEETKKADTAKPAGPLGK